MVVYIRGSKKHRMSFALPSIKKYTYAEVAAHATPASTWIIIDGRVYDVTGFASMHPGGVLPLRQYAGGDASDAFRAMAKHAKNPRVVVFMRRFQVGVIGA